MTNLDQFLTGIATVAISGHVRPDGDCVGSCLAVYNYIRQEYPHLEVSLFLEEIPEKFRFLKGADQIIELSDAMQERSFDLFIALDCGDGSRLGASYPYFLSARQTVCIDHHVTNQSFADENYIFPQASSASELVYELLPKEKISKEIAECIYLGIVHDTGVFQYSCTSSKTMRIAGELMDREIDYPWIVNETYFVKNYTQNRIWGKALADSELYLDGRCIFSYLTREDMEAFGATSKDTDGIVSGMRSTEGVEVSVFLYQTSEKEYKISMRSAAYVDVAKIAAGFGGGGHVRAAGATVSGEAREIFAQILPQIETQIKEHEA